MKNLKRIMMVLGALLTISIFNCVAQKSSDVQTTFDQILKKYEKIEGVTCMSVTKGSGLEMVKMMFNKEFGKDFMKGVTSISFIEYSDATEEICASLHKDLDAFVSLLEEVDLSKEKQFSDNKFLRCFASSSEANTISDFVVAIEDDDSKMLMYMAGKIKMEE